MPRALALMQSRVDVMFAGLLPEDRPVVSAHPGGGRVLVTAADRAQCAALAGAGVPAHVNGVLIAVERANERSFSRASESANERENESESANESADV